MNYDKILVDLFWDLKANSSTKLYRRFNQKMNHYKNIYNYLINRYNDSESIYESLMRLAYNIDKRPICKTCGGYVKFIGRPNGKGIYRSHCCASCRQKDIEVRKKQNDKKIEKYGSINNINKVLSTKLEKYGDATFNNRDKAKITNIEKYGYEHPMHSEIVKEKGKQTKLEKYKDPNFNNRDKAKITINQKYKDKIYFRIGSDEFTNNIIKKYGVDNISKLKEIHDKIKLKRFETYGQYQSPKQIEKIKSDEVNIKRINTKRKNNSFNISKTEDITYELLKEKYINVKRQYKSKLYPFCCDFYIPNYNDNIIDSGLYIECNYHWTHGFHLYNKDNKEDQSIVEKWKEKNTKYYDNAINTWTDLDIRKYNIAKENKLNYKLFYNINEFKQWLTNEL